MRFGLRELVFLGLLVAVPLAAWFVVFQPRHQQIEQARVEVEAKQATLRQLARVSSRIEDLRIEIESGREALDRLERRIPGRDGVDAVLQQITEIAMQNRLVVRSVKGDRPLAAPLYMELPLKMSIEGEFEGLYDFLAELESLERITRVHHLKVSRSFSGRNASEDLGSLKAELAISIFFDPGAAEAAPRL
jgi:type IV pilus assembly protein PilO